MNRFFEFLYKCIFGKEAYYRKLGVKFGKSCRFVGSVFFGSEPYLITLGNHVSISNSRFTNHDGGVWVFREDIPNINLYKKITVGNNVFIGDCCIILPGSVIGDNVVIGAGSIVSGVLESNSVYAGVPAKKIKSLQEYKDKIIPESIVLAACEKDKYLKSGEFG